MSEEAAIRFGVFTKPWPDRSLDDLGRFIAGLGFSAIELPVRPGFQVEPASAIEGLPRAKDILAQHGVEIASVAAPLEERVFEACARAEVPVIRTMAPLARGNYVAAERALAHTLRETVPWCRRYGVKLGVQEHYGDMVNVGVGLLHLLEAVDGAPHVGAIWDAAHDALAGQEPETSLDVVWDHLLMVNLKNAYYRRTTGPEAPAAGWDRYFTTGRHGLASWRRVLAVLGERGYRGTVCLTAEYTDEARVDELIAEDLAFAQSTWADVQATREVPAVGVGGPGDR